MDCRQPQSLHPGEHKHLPTLGTYVQQLKNPSTVPQFVDPASIETEGFIFPENYMSAQEREKALEYRKQYRSWRTKQNHGSHGEFNQIVDLTPTKTAPPQLPPRSELREFLEVGSPQVWKAKGRHARLSEDMQEHDLQADLARKRKSESSEMDEGVKRLKKADENAMTTSAEDDPMRVFDFLLGAC